MNYAHTKANGQFIAKRVDVILCLVARMNYKLE
jgi:hypothetical protein